MRLLHGKISTRILYLITSLFICSLLSIVFLTRSSKYDGPPPPFQRPTGTNSLKGIDPLLYNSGPPPGKLWFPGERPLANATLLVLARNSEADAMVQSMLDLERMFNSKFNYPWTFLNNVPFDEEFKRKTRAVTKAKISYELIPPEHWAVPSHIDSKVLSASMERLEGLGVQYSKTLSYHQMCRFNSGMFPFHPALLKYKYYWRVEPGVHFYCNLPYDPFHFLADRDLIYGFVIALYDSPASIASLWPEVLRFLSSYIPGKSSRNKARNPAESKEPHTPIQGHPVHPSAAAGFLTDSHYRPLHALNASGYSTCHFWSNFEIGDMDFFRSPLYQAYFRHLDQSGGFFYERWGDAPVHSIALSLFVDKKKIHWFRDIAYEHIPYFNCPRVDSSGAICGGNGGAKIRNKDGMEEGEGRCQAGRFTNGDKTVEEEDCRANWFHYAGID